MTENDNELLLFDRLEKIRSINEQYDLEKKAYLSFSGGKDSTILHYLLDMALPNNRIPRVFINTGIEYKAIVSFVKSLQEKDERVVILKPNQNVKNVLEKYGYPFKSKQHSHNLSIFQRNGMTETNFRYLGITRSIFTCPNELKYQFNIGFDMRISDNCCLKLKKESIKKWAKANEKSIVITGMKQDEGGQRKKLTCVITGKDNSIVKFHPLAVVTSEWEDWFVKRQNIKLCELYYEPYNFQRTGCKGCPFSLNLQKDLDVMAELLPNEKAQCERIWEPVYKEYRRLGYRLRPRNLFEMRNEK